MKFLCHLALEGLFILIELIQRHLKACTEVIFARGFSVLTNVALKPLKFGIYYSELALDLFLDDYKQTNKHASCLNYRIS
jgi:uncharacterized protein (DUF2344 family)